MLSKNKRSLEATYKRMTHEEGARPDFSRLDRILAEYDREFASGVLLEFYEQSLTEQNQDLPNRINNDDVKIYKIFFLG